MIPASHSALDRSWRLLLAGHHMRHFRPLFVACLGLIILPWRSSLAQSLPLPASCGDAAAIIQNGALAAVDSQRAAVAVVATCEADRPHAIAQAMSRRRTTVDTALISFVFNLRAADQEVVNTAADLASDRSASTLSRVASLKMLLQVTDSVTGVDFTTLHSTPIGKVCIPGTSLTRPSRGSIASAMVATAMVVGKTLENDESEDTAVRSAANCLMNSWRAARGFPVQLLEHRDLTSIQLTTICGTRFRLTNYNPSAVFIQYDQGAGSEEQVTELPPQVGGNPGLLTFRTISSTPVRVLFDGEVVATASAGTPCW